MFLYGYTIQFLDTVCKFAICLSILFFACSSNANAQSFGSALSFEEIGGSNQFGSNNTGSQTGQATSLASIAGYAPMLQGASNGTIAPTGDDASVIIGLNTAGTVRVNNLANLEALLNVLANGMEIIGVAWGGPTTVIGFMRMAAGAHDAMKRVILGMAGVTGGLATPGIINWLVASSRDANLFS